MYTIDDVREVLTTTGKLLIFQRVKPDLKRHAPLYLLVGVLTAWLAGIGRYWDHPHASWWQYCGLGSVAYIFILSLILFLLLWPLCPRHWSYRNVLIFVGLTSPPAILYAIPVERFLSLPMAQSVNVWFLAVVATWRVALLWRYLKESAALPGIAAVVALLLPLSLIITILTVLNLEKAVFEVMAGLHPKPPTVHDRAYFIMILLSAASCYASPVLFITYLYQIYARQKKQSLLEDAAKKQATAAPGDNE